MFISQVLELTNSVWPLRKYNSDYISLKVGLDVITMCVVKITRNQVTIGNFRILEKQKQYFVLMKQCNYSNKEGNNDGNFNATSRHDLFSFVGEKTSIK